MNHVSTITHALERTRFRESTEAALQDGVEKVLRGIDLPVEREVRLSESDRIDFLVETVGIECKIGGSLNDLIRQLHRYAQHERISELVVVTTRLTLARVPGSISGKPVHVVATMGGVL